MEHHQRLHLAHKFTGLCPLCSVKWRPTSRCFSTLLNSWLTFTHLVHNHNFEAFSVIETCPHCALFKLLDPKEKFFKAGLPAMICFFIFWKESWISASVAQHPFIPPCHRCYFAEVVPYDSDSSKLMKVWYSKKDAKSWRICFFFNLTLSRIFSEMVEWNWVGGPDGYLGQGHGVRTERSVSVTEILW